MDNVCYLIVMLGVVALS